jgi:hypothetical protein
MTYSAYKKLLFLFFFLITIISTIFLYNNYKTLAPISFVEWLNNYQYKFIRRAFFGNLIFIISNYLKANLLYITFLTQTFLYTFFYYFSFKIISAYKETNFLFLLAIFSPLGFIFPLAELSALGRQEIIFLFFISFYYFSILGKKKIVSQIILILLIPTSLLSHEGMIFYFSYLIFANFIFLKENACKYNFLINSFYCIYTLICFLYFILNFSNESSIIEYTCLGLNEYLNYEDCKQMNGIIKITEPNNLPLKQFLGMFSFFPVVKNIFFSLIGFAPIFLLSKFGKKISIRNFRIEPLSIIVICLLLSLPIYHTVDWGRWTYINYLSSLYLFIFLLKNNYFEFNKNYLVIYVNSITTKLKIMFFFIICFCWNLKILFVDNIGSLTLYRILRKTLKFIYLNIF